MQNSNGFVFWAFWARFQFSTNSRICEAPNSLLYLSPVEITGPQCRWWNQIFSSAFWGPKKHQKAQKLLLNPYFGGWKNMFSPNFNHFCLGWWSPMPKYCFAGETTNQVFFVWLCREKSPQYPYQTLSYSCTYSYLRTPWWHISIMERLEWKILLK